MKIAVSGISGFIGRHLVSSLERQGHDVVPVGRSFDGIDLSGISVAINIAGLAHAVPGVPYSEFKKVNCDYAFDFFNVADKHNAKLFIQISSIGVLGERSIGGVPLSNFSDLSPQDMYASSKAEAERHLLAMSESVGLSLCIIRPPLVYGRGCRGNMAALYRLAKLPIVLLPFGCVINRRDFISVHNLVDLIGTCVEKLEQASNQIFIASDCSTISSVELLSKLIRQNGNRFINIPVPTRLLKLLFHMIGKADMYEKFSADLIVDSSHAHNVLEWHPPYTITQALRVDFPDGG